VNSVDTPQPVPDSIYDITVLPADAPVTSPDASTVAIAGNALLHVPPEVAFVTIAADPTHTFVAPPIAAGSAFTVTVAVERQPVALIVYDTSAKPELTPVTVPKPLIVAIDGALLLHTPPDVTFERFVVDPWHTTAEPDIAAGVGLTVWLRPTIQPDGSVYVIAVVPAVPPLTTPNELIVATDVLVDVQVPPATAWVRPTV